jgi:hypothetical protein
MLTAYLHLVLGLRMSGAIQLIHRCLRSINWEDFTLTFTLDLPGDYLQIFRRNLSLHFSLLSMRATFLSQPIRLDLILRILFGADWG